MDKELREKLEEFIKTNLDKLSDEQLQALANYTETSLYENEYKDYI